MRLVIDASGGCIVQPGAGKLRKTGARESAAAAGLAQRLQSQKPPSESAPNGQQ